MSQNKYVVRINTFAKIEFLLKKVETRKKTYHFAFQNSHFKGTHLKNNASFKRFPPPIGELKEWRRY